MKRPSGSETRRPKAAADKIEIEPGAEKRLANILKKALKTPPQHSSAKAKKAGRKKPSEA